jgi:transcriptional regulator with XRE-family HTH domain
MATNPMNGVGERYSLTQTSYRRAVAAIVRNIQAQNRESDQDSADRIGVSAATIGNARNEKGDLAATTLLKIGAVYGLEAIGPAMLLIGGKAAPIEASCTSDREMPIAVCKGQMFLAEALSDNNRVDDCEIIAPGAAEAIEGGGQVFDTLRWRLNVLRSQGRVAA